MLAGEHDLRWLLRLARPDPDRDGQEDAEEELVDRLVYSLDDLLDTAERIKEDPPGRLPRKRRRDAAEQEAGNRMLQEAHDALEALAEGDLRAAAAVLGV